MLNEEILKKITGDIPDEALEALYRTGASILVNLVGVEGIDRLEDDNTIKTLLNKNKQFGELVIGFALAAVLELVPMPNLADDARKRLAYNLRVRSYEKIPEFLVRFTRYIPYIEDAAERALELAKAGPTGAGDRTSVVQPPPDTRETPGASDGHEGAAAATGEPEGSRGTRPRH